MKVSIIMGVYNCEKTVAEAIESIQKQTFTDWEFIICDDGSTDLTAAIIGNYTSSDKRIKLIRNNANKGLNYTLNHCLEHVKGDYIARMDGDDVSLPTRLEKEVLFLDKHLKYSIVSSPMIYFDENGVFASDKAIAEPQARDYIKRTPFNHAPCMVRKKAYDTVNGYSLNKKTSRVEDYDLWYRMYLHGFYGYNLNEPLYKMRDDRKAYSRRKYRYRLNEAYVKWNIFRDFKLPLSSLLYIFRPLIVGMLPIWLYKIIHSYQLNK